MLFLRRSDSIRVGVDARAIGQIHSSAVSNFIINIKYRFCSRLQNSCEIMSDIMLINPFNKSVFGHFARLLQSPERPGWTKVKAAKDQS